MKLLQYKLLADEFDESIPMICAELDKPSASIFLNYDKECFWNYVSSAKNVYYYKIFQDHQLCASLHIELERDVLYMSLLVFENYRCQGIGTQIISDLLSGVLPISFDSIEVSIAIDNIASIRLFEKCGFVFTSICDELLNYRYSKN